MTRTALIVAHGQPSAPAAAEEDLRTLAQRVQRHLPDWQVRSATLAAPDALGAALRGHGDPVVFPFFMADGWFIRTALPGRLKEAGARDLQILLPFGLLAATQFLAVEIVRGAAETEGWDIEATSLILAAHGSGRSPYPAEAARMTEKAISAACPFAAIRTGFIEEDPLLAETACDTGPQTLCLPLFAARWGHVVADIPAALEKANYTGKLLDPIGTHGKVPAIIAQIISEA